MEIRAARRRDLPVLVALWRDFRKESDPGFPDDRIEPSFLAVFEGRQKGLLLVACERDEIVGALFWLEAPAYPSTDRVWVGNGTFVRLEHRRAGVAHALWKEAISRLRGVADLILVTPKLENASVAGLKDLGFTVDRLVLTLRPGGV